MTIVITPRRARLWLAILFAVQAAAVGYAGYFFGINMPCNEEESSLIVPLPKGDPQ